MLRSKSTWIKVVIGIILLMFIIWNVMWFSYTTKYSAYTETVPRNELGLYLVTDAEGYNYSVKKPIYLSFTGNLSVVHLEKEIDLIIWPNWNGEFEYGVRLTDGSVTREIMMDRTFTPYDDYDDPQAKELIAKNIDSIKEIFLKAEEKFGVMD